MCPVVRVDGARGVIALLPGFAVRRGGHARLRVLVTLAHGVSVVWAWPHAYEIGHVRQRLQFPATPEDRPQSDHG